MIGLIISVALLSQASAIKWEPMETCSGQPFNRFLKLSIQRIEQGMDDWEASMWIDEKMNLGDAYLAKGCATEAERVFNNVLGSRASYGQIARARTGVDRSLALLARSQSSQPETPQSSEQRP
jgi:hypothetical protein